MKLIVFLITGLGFISCKSTYPVYKQLIDREIKHYGVNFKDTILDLGQDQMFMDELTSIEVDSLYFLGPSRDQDSTKPFSGFVSRVVFAQRNIDSVFISGLYHNVSTKFGDYYFSNVPNSIKSSNTLFVGGIGMKIENFISASISADKVIFRDSYFLYDNLEATISVIKKVLKDDGILIVVQDVYKTSGNYFKKKNLPEPKEEILIKYFESKGFKKVKSFREKSTHRAGFMNLGYYPDLVQIHFKKA